MSPTGSPVWKDDGWEKDGWTDDGWKKDGHDDDPTFSPTFSP